jgi:membrane protease YdiL (CAAX protease family)
MVHPLIASARSGQRLTPSWVAMPLSVVILIASILIGQALFRPMIPVWFGSPDEIQQSLFTSGLVQMLREITELGPVILCMWLILRFYEKRSLTSLGLHSQGAFSKLALGAALGFGLMAGWGAIGYLSGALVLEPAPVTIDNLGWGMVFVFLGVMVQTSAEEIVFRGWLFQVLSSRWGLLAGALVSALVFAAPHGLNDDITRLALLNIVVLAFFFAQLAWYQESLWGLIGFHWFYNWTQFSVLGLDVTPDEALGGAIFNLGYTDNVPFVTTGVVAEDGMIMTIIAVSAVTVMSILIWRKQT